MTAARQATGYAAIVGLGRTGLSSARWLSARGWRVAVTDSRTEPPELPGLRALDTGIQAALGGLMK